MLRILLFSLYQLFKSILYPSYMNNKFLKNMLPLLYSKSAKIIIALHHSAIHNNFNNNRRNRT